MMTIESEQAQFQERGFGRRLGFGRAPAVMVVDAMNGFTDPSSPLGAEFSRELDAINEVLRVARKHHLPVIHTVVRYDSPELLDAGLWRIKQAGSWRLTTGSRDVQLDDRVEVTDEDQILVKKFASAFHGTDLISRLVSGGLDTVVLAGFTTSGCVRASAVDAVQNGFRPVVIREAVGDRSSSAHEQSLFDLDQKYADVISLAELCEHFS